MHEPAVTCCEGGCPSVSVYSTHVQATHRGSAHFCCLAHNSIALSEACRGNATAQKIHLQEPARSFSDVKIEEMCEGVQYFKMLFQRLVACSTVTLLTMHSSAPQGTSSKQKNYKYITPNCKRTGHHLHVDSGGCWQQYCIIRQDGMQAVPHCRNDSASQQSCIQTTQKR